MLHPVAGKNSWGPWAGRSGYLGLKFYIKGKVHYGWARLNAGYGYTSPPKLTGYAYETITGRAVAGTPRQLLTFTEEAWANDTGLPSGQTENGTVTARPSGISSCPIEVPVGALHQTAIRVDPVSTLEAV